jgi:hypothetical protein
MDASVRLLLVGRVPERERRPDWTKNLSVNSDGLPPADEGCATLSRHLVVLAQDGRQTQCLEMMFQQDLRCIGVGISG